MNDKKRGNEKLGVETNKNFVPYDRLIDTPARLFRVIGEKIGLNSAMWRSLMTDHLRMIHPDSSGDARDVRKARSTSFGNAQNTYFFSAGLTFDKLMEGLKILKVKKLTITLTCELENGKIVEAAETTYLRSSKDTTKS